MLRERNRTTVAAIGDTLSAEHLADLHFHLLIELCIIN